MIHVAYRLWGGDGFFAKMCGTSMLSMFENTREKVTVHIMHNNRLTPDNRGKLCYIAGQYNQQVEFHNVEEIAGATLRKFEAAYPIKSGINAAWYPFIVHEVFPDLDKIIFLGADTVFNLDVVKLWAYDLKPDCGIAAIPEALSNSPKMWLKMVVNNLVDYDDYFNADILLVKPDFFRENFENILKACKFVHENGYLLNEQDVLNYLFSKKYLKLPGKFNSMLIKYHMFTPKPHHLEKKIYHFSGIERPYFDTDDVYNRLYLEYFLKTPWANVEMFGNIHRATENLFRSHVGILKNNMLRITNLLTRCKRVFFVDKKNLNSLKQIFEVKDDELIIDASSPDAPKNLLQALNKHKGKKIFFLLAGNYWQLAMFLRQNNFIEGTDFFNGNLLLSEQYGVREDFAPISRSLLQEM